MKNLRKISLDTITVDSFITNLESTKSETVLGGQTNVGYTCQGGAFCRDISNQSLCYETGCNACATWGCHTYGQQQTCRCGSDTGDPGPGGCQYIL